MPRLNLIALALSVGFLPALVSPVHGQQDSNVAVPQLRVQKILIESGQALLWDFAGQEYALVRVGDAVGDWHVESIHRKHVVLTGTESDTKYVFPVGRKKPKKLTVHQTRQPERPMSPWDGVPSVRAPAGKSAPIDPWSPSKAPGTPIDPFGSRHDRAGAVLDPYASIPSTKAPGKARAATPRSGVLDPYASIASVKAPAKTRSDRPGRIVVGAPKAIAPAVAVSLHRSEFDAALSDFHALSKQVNIEGASGGGFRITKLSRSSYFYRAGLRKGDVVRKVAGAAVNSIDDAAVIYARIGGMTTFEIELVRRGAPATLRFRFGS